MKRRIIVGIAIAALVVIAIATSGFGLIARPAGPLTLYGNVDVREVEMAFQASGRVEEIPVEEGERVEKGDLLASIDASQAQDRLRQADAELAQARASLAKLQAGNRPQEIASANARLSAARAALDKAQQDYDRRQPLLETGAISRANWKATETALETAQAQYREAAEAASLTRQGARREDIAAARAQLQAAEAARGSVDTDLSFTRLEAPVDGVIMTRAVEPGSLVAPGATAFTIAIDRPMRVRAYVAQTDLSRISPGMKVTVTADGNPKEYQGTIGFISPRAEFTPKQVETEDLRTDLVYRLRIIVSDPDDGLRQGQPVTVNVLAARAPAED
ncbi:HlyD family efflux transporter periplasmic adaptor subunit [Croceicoccus mobilis]|uniref:Secretion protein HlyD n=1 Tax=Croceicoccus mobilis TaxID=1703339 RepID=A0A917DTP7_9SPHN|nr:HlyD family efflux transporter periplasmic adaptor subunit [Croceicoccus mobilis]GGD69462.1 secretion protein HlyD [Croceicoccus mobilis]